jgi:hypothetical protein
MSRRLIMIRKKKTVGGRVGVGPPARWDGRPSTAPCVQPTRDPPLLLLVASYRPPA